MSEIPDKLIKFWEFVEKMEGLRCHHHLCSNCLYYRWNNQQSCCTAAPSFSIIRVLYLLDLCAKSV